MNLSKCCGILYKIRYNLSTGAMRNIYFSLCYPYIIYCLSVWGCTWPSVINDVIVTQKRILRNITYKNRTDSTNEAFNDLGLLKFEFLRKYFLILATFNNINNDSENIIFRVVQHNLGTWGN